LWRLNNKVTAYCKGQLLCGVGPAGAPVANMQRTDAETEPVEMAANKIRLYPNPATDQLIVKINKCLASLCYRSGA